MLQYLINSRFSPVRVIGESLFIIKRNYLQCQRDLEYLKIHLKAVKDTEALIKVQKDYLKI